MHRQKWLITKKNCPTKYRHNLSDYLVPALGECMSADSCYSGKALSGGFRSKALTVFDIWPLKILQKKTVQDMGPRSERFVVNSILSFRRVKHFLLCLLETQVAGMSGICLNRWNRLE